MTTSDLLVRAKSYAQSRQIQLKKEDTLGYGSDGTVWMTARDSALKVFENQKGYDCELECYQRLKARNISEIRGLSVPRLIDFDTPLMAIEMTIVQAPYLLDFAKVYIDCQPPYAYDPQLIANFESDGRDMFGKRWKDVRVVMAILQQYGICYVDPRPGNIDFGEEQA